MNKSKLINTISTEINISKTTTQKVLNTLIKNIIKSVKNGKTVQLIGFGSFSTNVRNRRIGRNPQTGAEIQISAKTTIRFTPSKFFKETVNRPIN